MSLDDADGGTQYFGPNARLVHLPNTADPIRVTPERAVWIVDNYPGAWMEGAPPIESPSQTAANRAKEAAVRKSILLRANLRAVESEQAYHRTVAEQHTDLANSMQPTINILKTQIERAEQDENDARPR